MRASTSPLYFSRTGSGTPLLLIHGLLVNGDMFQPVVTAFAQRCDVLVPDLRGHGRSAHLPPPYTIAQHAQDLVELLASLSLSSVVVMGYSQGGTVAQQLAFTYPHLVQRLLLACTFAYNRATWQEQVEGLLLPWIVRLLPARQLARSAGGLSVEQLQHLEAMIASNRRPAMVEAIRALLRFDSRRRLSEIRCPTCIIAGADDRAVPLHHAAILANGISGATVQIVQHAGHTLLWTHTGAFISAVTGFLDATS